MKAPLKVRAVLWEKGSLVIIDQTQLPHTLAYRRLSRVEEVAEAIRSLRVRGAPAIGVAAAYGVALAVRNIKARSPQEMREKLEEVLQTLEKTRPTAVNLFRALDRMRQAARRGTSPQEVRGLLLAEARALEREEKAASQEMGELGAQLLADGDRVLTHCNTGALATAGAGTALAVIKAAWGQGKKLHVFVTETRPLLQGARLTAWELQQEGIPFTLITDSMAGYFLQRGQVKAVLVGADRIAANGDVANKIGTYTLAVLATETGVPFYVVAPTSTIDPALASGEDIPIEERNPEEVTHLQGTPIAPEGTAAANPAFDVTPHQYISAIVTEKGILREPYQERIAKIQEGG